MFGIKIQGRLGNQMFQYAFALAQSKRLNAGFYLHKIYRFRLNKYFDIPVQNYLFHYPQQFFFLLKNKFSPQILTQNQGLPALETLEEFSKDNVLIEGFFQSSHFFKNVENEVKRQFTVKKQYRININDFTNNNSKNIIIHIRRTDYLNWGTDELGYNLALPPSYYSNAIQNMNIEAKNIIFISDDIAFAKKNFKIEGAFFSENNSEIFDLQLLMQADYIILSNSTFAWWGAYLNNKAEKIYSPLHWLGFKVGKEWPSDITPAQWIKVKI